MCGRFALISAKEKITQVFQLKNSFVTIPRYNIAPGQMVPVIRQKGTLEFIEWGLKPYWMKDNPSSKLINARAETITEKKSFCRAFAKRRCLVIADGYYEWIAHTKKKQPYYITLINKAIFAFAGIWENNRCAILTIPAITALTKVHYRMPLILSHDHYSSWLGSCAVDSTKLQEIIDNQKILNFSIRSISLVVNDAKKDSPQCIR